MSKKVFLSAPFQNKISKDHGRMTDSDIKKIDRLIRFLEDKGYEVCNAHLREKWGEEWMKPNICTKIDFDEIKKSDLVIALLDDDFSGGAYIEMGWSSAFEKRIILILKEGIEFSNLVHGLKEVSNVEYITYDVENDYFERLNKIL